MKKQLITVILLIPFVLNLVACSKSDIREIKVKDGVIYNGSESVGVTEHRGYEAATTLEGVGEIEYYLCNTMDNCQHNASGVLVSDMTDYKGKCKYYTMYLGTKVYLYVPYGKQYIESCLTLNEVEGMTTESAIDIMVEESKRLFLSTEVKEVNYEDIVTFRPGSWTFKLRPDELFIPGTIRVKKDDGSIVATSKATIGGVTVGKYTTAKYDYYQGNGVIVQATIGTDVEEFVTLK